MPPPQTFQLALSHHQAGRLADAEALYRQILTAQPNHPEALHFLGLIAHQVGRHEVAVELMRHAILLDPNNAFAYSNLGIVCLALGRVDEGLAAFRRALELKPDYPEAHVNLGAALNDQGRSDEAMAAFRRALELKPGYPEARNNLGNALRDRGRLTEAVAEYRHALALKPGYPQAHNNLGNTLREMGQFEEAIAACRRALELKPDLAEACHNLGNALRDRGQLDEANAAYRKAVELRPNYAEAQINLGNVLWEQGRLDEAAAASRRALELKPDSPEAFNNLGNALGDRGEHEEAVRAFRRALELKPDSAEMHSNLLYTLSLHPGSDAQTISDVHQRWNRQFSEPLKQLLRPHANERGPNRPLRIGYVSPDFRDHPVGRYLLPLFGHHDREWFEILCYSGVKHPDGVTERLRALAAKWRSTIGVSDARLAETIREDEVDILVDLSLHNAGNRLLVFAQQPAPVQVTWLGYPGSTGLSGIGYRLTDAYMDPPGPDPAWSAEEPVRLPDCWCCYQPPRECPEINPLPALSAGCVTFGSLNKFAKVNDRVLALWARVLESVNASRLIMFCPEGSARERVRAFFEAHGIREDRVELAGFLSFSDYLQLYHRIDIALDPFPCNGMTTTCDALWMGVPVVTLPGELPISRAGLSLLSTIGLRKVAASSEDNYVWIANELAKKLPRLSDLRSRLRARMLASPLMDAPRFAKSVEAAYLSMWRRWCAIHSRRRKN